LRSVIEGTTDAIFVKDLQGRYLLANVATAKSLGRPAEEVLGKNDAELLPPEVARPLMESDRRVMDTTDTHTLEEDVSVEGDTRTFLSTKSVFRNHRGETAGIIGVSTDITELKRAEEQVREIKESERRRIAAELHDTVLQDLVYGLQEIQLAQLAGRSEGSNLTPGLEGSLEMIGEALQRSVEGLREAIFELRLDETLERSAVSSVESLVELNRRMSRKWYEVHLSVEGFPDGLSTDAGRELVRIVQEALNNARRHSGANNIGVTLKMEGGAVHAEVTDDGRGFDPENARGGVGTSAMRQRALNLGGELEIQSEPGWGTLVRFRGPVDRLMGN
jgi:PAS domain S-box-containing protein